MTVRQARRMRAMVRTSAGPAATLLVCGLMCGTPAQDTSSHGAAVAPHSLFRASSFNEEFRSFLYIGYQTDTLFTNLHAGFDFPFVGLHMHAEREFQLGAAALLHIYTIPRTSNMKFFVDNFYAGFGLYVSGRMLPWLLWRIFPVYHVSAHLADGHPADSPLWQSVHAVSNEVLKGEVAFLPVRSLEIGCAAGWYYHSVGRDLKATAALNVQYAPRIREHLEPYAQLLAELVVEEQVRLGYQAAGGMRFVGRRGAATGLALRAYSRPHPGYHSEHRQIGYGVELFFNP